MPYPQKHLYLTLHWAPGNVLGETGQCGIRFRNPTAPATQSLVDACQTAVRTFWAAASSNIAIDYQLRFIRLAQIDTDGKYVPGTSSFDSLFTPLGVGVSGGGTAYVHPLQVAAAATLTTARPHGQASKGRVFLPPFNLAPASDYHWTATQVAGRTTSLATMITALSGVLGGPAAILSKGTVKSSVGAIENVTGVKIGTRPDVQRRRARALGEAYGIPVNTSFTP